MGQSNQNEKLEVEQENPEFSSEEIMEDEVIDDVENEDIETAEEDLLTEKSLPGRIMDKILDFLKLLFSSFGRTVRPVQFILNKLFI